MKVIVKKKNEPFPVLITTDYIKLESAMKLAALVETGGEAKRKIQAGQVTVNSETCTQRGRKLRPGDEFCFRENRFVIHAAP